MMMMARSLEALEKQYPSLDSSLIAALASDCGELSGASSEQLERLHETLGALCFQDDATSALEQASLTSGSGSRYDSSSDTSSASLSTPLGFLQTLFPHIESSILQSALEEHGPEDLDPVIESLLSTDLIRELQEDDYTDRVSVEEWTRVSRGAPPASKPKPKPKPKPQGKGKGKGRQPTLVIGDIRHRQLNQPRASAPTIDPWTYIDSVAARLGSILPNVPSSVFSSAFHNPVYSTPSAALRATLADLGHTHTVDDFALASLLTLLDAGPEEASDASLCLKATASDPNDAYHLVEILRQVDRQEPVVVHLPRSPDKTPMSPPAVKHVTMSAPPGWPATTPGWTATPRVKSAWETVPVKSASAPAPVEARFDELDAERCLEEALYWQEKRRTALKQASELYTRHKHEHGGEAALYYSNLAKDHAAKEREWRLKAAKASVRERQDKSCTKAIDLHGLTVHESLEVVKESVNTWWSSAGSSCTPNEPLQIITGQGRHSKGNVPVIGPAVMKQLQRDGWRAHKREGTVYVTGLAPR
ncbi:Smr domain containing protein [Ceratobasidium theobromae]|uniref:Smr domain containing protein n=1 Tax=Ceratobasidium theobromae TaxID=1582974 RepID=A0A5N5QHJ7_9AGAM|nr:Smr domain containing protein [Ceratobasidium theobromae]